MVERSRDGLLNKNYETHCFQCEEPALGLGNSVSRAIKTLRTDGWSRHQGRWICWACTDLIKKDTSHD